MSLNKFTTTWSFKDSSLAICEALIRQDNSDTSWKITINILFRFNCPCACMWFHYRQLLLSGCSREQLTAWKASVLELARFQAQIVRNGLPRPPRHGKERGNRERGVWWEGGETPVSFCISSTAPPHCAWPRSDDGEERTSETAARTRKENERTRESVPPLSLIPSPFYFSYRPLLAYVSPRQATKRVFMDFML